ncbi:uroporphyrinogen-III C-methyltransferase [bacterium]|nr:uroporphyrinogen-III C-methyltransferase [bacterium]
MSQAGKGKIYLVGAGPGDPELITFKAVRAIAAAEVIVYDYLVNPALLEHARPEAERIYVGKKAGAHTLRQEEINALLVKLASQGKIVTRLKGGDPFVFGRGGEEALEAVEAGVEFEVIPGVTAGVAVPAYAGIPVTQRGVASSVTFITGHEDPRKEESDIDWAALAALRSTLVFYMGVSRLESIAAQLVAHGLPGSTPAAVIHRGATAHQRTVCGTLADIAARVREAALAAPAIIVVGEVVALREKLDWFERRPLFGRTVIVTRSREQASVFTGRLAELGAAVIELPAIEIGDSPDPDIVRRAVDRLPGGFDWVVFTSVNGVERFFRSLRRAGKDVRALAGARLAAIGPSTAAALESAGLSVDMLPEKFVAESVADSFAKLGESLEGKRILLPRAEIARKVLPEALAALGAEVMEVPVYSTRITRPENLPQVLTELAAGQVDLVTFTSSSTVDNFVELVGLDSLKGLGGKPVYAAIGPVTEATAAGYGLAPLISAGTHTIEGLTALIENYFAKDSVRY